MESQTCNRPQKLGSLIVWRLTMFINRKQKLHITCTLERNIFIAISQTKVSFHVYSWTQYLHRNIANKSFSSCVLLNAKYSHRNIASKSFYSCVLLNAIFSSQYRKQKLLLMRTHERSILIAISQTKASTHAYSWTQYPHRNIANKSFYPCVLLNAIFSSQYRKQKLLLMRTLERNILINLRTSYLR